MSLEGRHVWLATRAGERVPLYQASLVAALEAQGVASALVIGVDRLLRSAAQDLGERATEWLGSTASKVARGLRIDRLLGRDDEEDDGGEVPEDPDAPDLVVVDDARLLQALRLTPLYRRQRPFTVALVDDFSVDTRWRGAPVDAVVVPHEALAAVYRRPDSPVEVVVAGPPLDPGLLSELEPVAAKQALGLAEDAAVILVAAERFRLDVLDRAVFQLTLLDKKPVVLFHVGQSSERAQVLREASNDYGLRAQMFGDVSGLAGIYAAADVVLASADDPAAVELLLTRRPLVLVGPDRGTARAAFLHDQGAVLHVPDIVELGTHLDTLLGSEVGSGLVEVAQTLVDPAGCDDVANKLGRLLADHEARQAAPPEPEEPPEPEPEGPAESGPLAKAPTGQPFESIGAASRASTGAVDPPITAAEAKDQMAALIIKERESERSLSDAVKGRDRWLDRLELAKEFGDQDLIEVAAEKLQLASAHVSRINGKIETIRRAKGKLKERVAGKKDPGSRPAEGARPHEDSLSSGNSAVEARFRKLEIDRDLSRLRRRLDDD